MALPTLTSNSPAAGSIAWTAFGIQYNGTSYSIAAGNSTFKFIWWEQATNTVKGSNTLPTLADADCLLFLNKNGIGVLVPTTDVLDGSLIVPQSIYANAIAADQINATHVQAGSIGATELAAGAVTTEKLTVGSVGDNLVTNGSFEEFGGGVPLGWQAAVEAGTGSSDVVSGVSSSGSYAARLIIPNATSGARLSQTDAKVIPVTSIAGRSWYVSARVGASVATTRGFYLRVDWLTAAKAYISNSNIATNQPLTTAWAAFDGRVTPPSTARYMRVMVICTLPNVATNVYVDEIAAREVVVAAQIGDGQIVAAHLKADAIDGKTITGVTIMGGTVIGTEVKTDDTAGAVVARMGQQSAWDGAYGTTRAGIGFAKIGSAGEAYPAGMYSLDGANLTIATSGGGTGPAPSAINMVSPKGSSPRVSIDVPSGDIQLNGNTTANGTQLASKHAEFTNGGFTVAGGNVSWDIGPLTVDTTKSTSNYASVLVPGPVSGSVKALEAGYYTFTCATTPQSGPGNSMLRPILVYAGSGSVILQTASNSGVYWENSVTTGAIYMGVNDYIKFQVNHANQAITSSRVWAHKLTF